MKKALLFLSVFIVVTLACDLSVTVAPPTSPAPVSTNTPIPVLETATQIPASATPVAASATPVPVTSAPNPSATSQQPYLEGMTVTYRPLNLVLPFGVASGFSGDQPPRADGDTVAPWERTPGHTQIKLEGYFLQGKFHEPQIYVYPALDYAQMFPAAFESIHSLDNILYGPGGPISVDQLPTVPFFQAAQLFASNVQVISFQNGSGVRFLTEYAQYAASANNHDLFYHFEGVTRDGEYYMGASPKL